jgi:hypothetical protein
MCVTGLGVAGCGGGRGAGGGRGDAIVDSGMDKDFRRADAEARTVFSEPPLEPVSERRLASGAPGPGYWQQKADYWIEATLDEPARKVMGKERVRYENRSPHELRFVWMNLEQNLFRKDSDGELLTKPSARFGNRDRHEGGFAITRVEVNGVETTLHEYGTVGRIDLDAPLVAGGVVEIRVEWSFAVPKYGSDRLGIAECKDGEVFEIAQWFPSVCVYDDVHGWNTLPYLGQGEFYTDFGDYEVAITVPADHVVAACGELTNPGDVLGGEQYERWKKAREGEETVVIRSAGDVDRAKKESAGDRRGTQEKTWRFAGKNERTFAWASSAAFIWDGCGSKIPGHDARTFCQSFYPREALPAWDGKTKEGGSSQMLRKSIEHYSKMWYPYPYPWAVNVNGVVGGMEYPGLAMCGGREDPRGLWGVTTHEIGHTWFPMIMSTNERRHAWMDEGFNTFINYYASKERYPADEPYRGSAAKFGKNQKRPLPQPVETAADRIADGYLGVLEYEKTAVGLVMLRETILGEERFDAAFREYCRRWAFKHPYPGDFFRTMEDVSGKDLGWFWRGWFYSTGVLDQSVTGVVQGEGDGKGLAHITFAQRGGLVMPIEYRVTFDDGTKADRRVPVEGFFWTDKAVVTAPTGGKRIKMVEVDPERSMPDVERGNNVWRR